MPLVMDVTRTRPEKPVLQLMFGAMIRVAERWRTISVSEPERSQSRQICPRKKRVTEEPESK